MTTILIATFNRPVDQDTAYDVLCALDLAREAVAATADGQIVEVYASAELRILWLPYEGRAGIVTTQGTGDAQWTDARSPEDAARRFCENDLNP